MAEMGIIKGVTSTSIMAKTYWERAAVNKYILHQGAKKRGRHWRLGIGDEIKDSTSWTLKAYGHFTCRITFPSRVNNPWWINNMRFQSRPIRTDLQWTAQNMSAMYIHVHKYTVAVCIHQWHELLILSLFSEILVIYIYLKIPLSNIHSLYFYILGGNRAFFGRRARPTAPTSARVYRGVQK
jgi:hypothetical protein